MARRMEALYGAAVVPGSYKRGTSHGLRMVLESVAGEFLPGRPDQLGDGIAFLAEQLAHPRLAGGGSSFPADVFEVEKREAVDALRALADDKGAWAQLQAMSFACVGERIAIREHGTLEAVEALEAADPERARTDFLGQGRMHVIAGGAIPSTEEALLEHVEALLADLGAAVAEEIPAPEAVAPRDTRHRVERAAGMQQAKLEMFFRLPPGDGTHEQHAGRRVFDQIFGGGPQSRLFREVREARSLAYYAQSGYDRHTHLLVVRVGCDAENAAAVEAEVCAQVQALAKGDFEDSEVDAARAQIGARLARVDDGLGSGAFFVGEQLLHGDDRTPAQAAEHVVGARREAIAAAAADAWLDAVYLLEPADGDAK